MTVVLTLVFLSLQAIVAVIIHFQLRDLRRLLRVVDETLDCATATVRLLADTGREPAP